MAKEKEKPPKKYSIIVKFEHLNPALQEIIGEKPGIKDRLLNQPISEITKSIMNKLGRDEVMTSPRRDTIRRLRSLRAFYEGGSLMSLLLMADAIKSKEMPSSKLLGGGTALMAACRTLVAKLVQWRHRDLVKAMKDFGILQTKYEKGYPKDWINPTIVSRTHPTFYVNRKGDLIFPKMTRIEYARYVFQKRFPGKLGLNSWRWRAYLEPPERPEKVTDFVNAKIRQWLATMRPKPAFGLATARAKAARQRKARSKHRRKA